MKARQFQNANETEFEKDSYEGSLTEKQRRDLYVMLRSDAPFDEVLAKAPPWGRGIAKGKQPSLKTLSAVNERLDFEALIVGLEGASALAERTTKKMGRSAKGRGEQILDRAMELIGNEVIRRTLSRRNLGERDEAAKLLLKRADQRRVDRRLDMLEADSKKNDKTTAGGELTPEKQEAHYKQILGIEI